MKKKMVKFFAKILCVSLFSMLFCEAAFADIPSWIQQTGTYYKHRGSPYEGSDKDPDTGTNYFYLYGHQQYIRYPESGSTDPNDIIFSDRGVSSKSDNYTRAPFYIEDPSGQWHTAYCIAADIPLEDMSYKVNGLTYFDTLPLESRKGIALAAYYGYQPGKQAFLDNTNVDDYKIATQIIIWEYEQQLRNTADRNGRHTNQWIQYKDEFYNTIKGRHAEWYYNWILDQIKAHETSLSFTTDSSATAASYNMTYNQSTGKSTVTITDTNNLLSSLYVKDVKIGTESLSTIPVTVSKNDNKYTFTLDYSKLTDAQKYKANTFSIRLSKSNSTMDLQTWGGKGGQPLISGYTDPSSFFVNLSAPSATGEVGTEVGSGDDSESLVWLILGGLSLMLIVVCTLRKKSYSTF